MSAMKEIVRKILTSYVLNEESRDPVTQTTTAKDMLDAAIQAADGDKVEGTLLYLFQEQWSNDIVALATYYGYELRRRSDGGLELFDGVPPAPSLDHVWDGENWVKSLDTSVDEVVAMFGEAVDPR